MSMFHELMMRKKEEIMYATIKGTLTENNGVFSGFTYNNYLVTQEEFDYSKDFEIVLKTNAGNLSLTSYKIIIRSNSGGSIAGASGCAIGIENQRLRSYMINSEGGYIADGSFGVSSFVNDADYFFKFSQKIDNGIYTIKLETSTDGINWTTENSWTSSLPIRNSGQGIAFGGGRFSSTTQYWAGSIDLNNSYIKIGATKYNLQAVVGYTIVGSPTITDGVVSGMNSSNYLTVPNFPYVSADSWEIVINADTTYNSGQPQQRLLRINSYFQLQVQGAEPKWQFYNGTDVYSIITSEEGLVSTYKFVKMVKSSGASSIQFYVSTDGITWITGNSISISSSATDGNMSIGANGNGWLGTVNLNNTYIKVNNKLWFNGQPS